jgi:acetyl esterase/lipase
VRRALRLAPGREAVHNDALQQSLAVAMPSLRARAINRFLRLSTRRIWRPGLDIEQVRQHTATMDVRLSRRAPPIAMEQVDIDGMPATWFGTPELERKGTLLYLHGGAWCLHLPGIYRSLMTALSQQTGMRVLLPDYRLAPEHPFPAGIDDCFAAYRWLAERGCAERPFALAGDSAGGNLALVTLMRARDALLPLPDCAVLLSPVTDLTASGPSQRYNAKADPMFSPAAVDLLPDVYCPGQDRRNPLLSPLFGNWNGLPPLLFHAGSTEMLLDDSIRAQDRAVQAGVEAEIEVWVGLPHVFHVFRLIPESRTGVRAVAEFIGKHASHRRESVAAWPETAITLDDTVTYPAF